MKETLDSLRHKIERARELEGVVRTMKAMSASNIAQYEQAMQSLDDYYRTVELGLFVCFPHPQIMPWPGAARGASEQGTAAIVFGSDQGLVGQFNDVLANFAVSNLERFPGPVTIWAAGNSIDLRLESAGWPPARRYAMPHSIEAITPLIGQLLADIERSFASGEVSTFYLLYNRPQAGAVYEPECRRFIPLDETWLRDFKVNHWPTPKTPEVLYSAEKTIAALMREYFFVSLFRACAESLASENASRLAAMQRAEKNIGNMLNDLSLAYHQLRQNSIDEELFDLIFGSEALKEPEEPNGPA